MSALTFICPNCKKQRRPVRNEALKKLNCLKCSLYGTLLRGAFSAIVTQPDMVEFNEEMNTWYCHDETS
jgi:hypothetical protein